MNNRCSKHFLGLPCERCAIEALESDNARLKAEVERLIGCWTEIDRVKADRDRYRDACGKMRHQLEIAIKCLKWSGEHDTTSSYAKGQQPPRGEPIGPNDSPMTPREIADVYVPTFERALALFETMEEPRKEILYSGQCNHHIPIGQPCAGCHR